MPWNNSWRRNHHYCDVKTGLTVFLNCNLLCVLEENFFTHTTSGILKHATRKNTIFKVLQKNNVYILVMSLIFRFWWLARMWPNVCWLVENQKFFFLLSFFSFFFFFVLGLNSLATFALRTFLRMPWWDEMVAVLSCRGEGVAA